jgi:hypothetical protein
MEALPFANSAAYRMQKRASTHGRVKNAGRASLAADDARELEEAEKEAKEANQDTASDDSGFFGSGFGLSEIMMLMMFVPMLTNTYFSYQTMQNTAESNQRVITV